MPVERVDPSRYNIHLEDRLARSASSNGTAATPFRRGCCIGPGPPSEPKS
jgi:hypothetical protein